MDAMVKQTVEGILDRMRSFLTTMVAQAFQAGSPQEARDLERAFRREGQGQMAAAYQQVLQAATDAGDGGRCCPHCQGRRKHKGRRPRKLLTSVGPVTVEGVLWRCGACGVYEHASVRRGLPAATTTAPLRELLCLLGLSQGSFAKAELACDKLLGFSLSAPTMASVCEEEGRRVEAADLPEERLVSGTLVGSCDGTMMHTREEGWRELRAWRFDDDRGRRASGAALEDAAAFAGRLRREALGQHAGDVRSFAFVSDAAEWIRQLVGEHLPEASEHVVDIYHAYQHVHDAAKALHGEGTPRAQSWARQWCDELFLRGGTATLHRLRHARFRRPHQQQALAALRGFLERHAPRMDYPRLRKEGLPISSGPMESTCKQLGLRLKGPGMRWRTDSLTPMAHLICLWGDQRWDQYWKSAA